MRTVALATHRGCPKLSADDQLLIPLLRDFDIEAQAVVWDNQETDWSEFDQVIIRSCWDYHLRLPEFFAWISLVESRDVDLQNSGALERRQAVPPAAGAVRHYDSGNPLAVRKRGSELE